MDRLVKGALRVTADAPGIIDEIENLIDACILDLTIAGVRYDEKDDLIRRAVVMYAKGHFGYDNPEADRFLNSYEMLKQHLMLSGDYREVE